MRFFALLLCCLAVAASSVPLQQARAEPQTDAEFIVDKFMTEESVNAMFNSMEPLLRTSMTGSLSRGPAQRLTARAREAVITEFVTQFRERFASKLKDKVVSVYLETYTQDELAGLKAFLETPAGQSYSSKQHLVIQRSSAMGRTIGAHIGVDIALDIGTRLKEEGSAFSSNEEDLAILRGIFPSP